MIYLFARILLVVSLSQHLSFGTNGVSASNDTTAASDSVAAENATETKIFLANKASLKRFNITEQELLELFLAANKTIETYTPKSVNSDKKKTEEEPYDPDNYWTEVDSGKQIETTTVKTYVPTFENVPATDALKIRDAIDNIANVNPTLYVLPIIIVLFFTSFAIAFFVFLRQINPIHVLEEQSDEKSDEKDGEYPEYSDGEYPC